jgi:hypothetical protein
MLGGLAYQDSVGEINIDKIKARTADTAADIFVYDTRKDSDGGAWRHRTQHLSWYNEGASATRGARKEFPAVAVIVAETDTLTIYDGDDSNLSMWMVFEANTDSQDLFINDSSSSLTSVAALNGRVFAGSTRTSTTGNITGIDFIGDRGGMAYTSSSDIRTYAGGVGQRNDGLGNYASTSNWFTSGAIVNRNVNDVAMTVLPNAPIDANTGLPIPTIAVATDGGVSVIKDDGTVIDGTSTSGSNYSQTKQITFTEENYLWWLADYFGGGANLRDSYALSLDTLPSSDFTWDNGSDNLSVGDYYAVTTGNESGDIKIGYQNDWAWNKQERNALGSPSGLAIHKPNIGSKTNSLIVAITSDYNTGWMHGDCKLAALCDTDTTNISGVNLMSGATYNTSARVDSYSYTNGSSTLTINDQQSTVDGYVNLTLGGLTASTNYIITVTGNQTYTPTSGFNHHLGNTSDGTVYFEDNFVGTTTPQSLTFKTPSSGNPTIVLYSGYNGTITYTLDLRLVEFDRSRGTYSAYNSAQSATIGQQDGLGIHGTIPRQPVATGAELVSYGPFSTLNRLSQPYNSDLTFGTNDFSIMFWVNHDGTDAHQTIVGRDEREFNIFILSNSTYSRKIRCYAHDSSNNVQHVDSLSNPFPMNSWNHICVNYTGGNTVSIYINGVLNNSGTLNYDIDNTTYALHVGVRNAAANSGISFAAANCKIALLRISKSAPLADQVKKIYEDERCLYRENAKCILYGTSDAVTALAHDDTTDVLHVGTSGGRSEFQGLNRINNTTTAVTTAISASDGLVAEQ